MTTTTIDPLEAVKQRQQATWASGDYSAVAALIVPVAERLVDLATCVPARACSTSRPAARTQRSPPPGCKPTSSGSTTSRHCSTAAASGPPPKAWR